MYIILSPTRAVAAVMIAKPVLQSSSGTKTARRTWVSQHLSGKSCLAQVVKSLVLATLVSRFDDELPGLSEAGRHASDGSDDGDL